MKHQLVELGYYYHRSGGGVLYTSDTWPPEVLARGSVVLLPDQTEVYPLYEEEDLYGLWRHRLPADADPREGGYRGPAGYMASQGWLARTWASPQHGHQLTRLSDGERGGPPGLPVVGILVSDGTVLRLPL